MFLFSVSFQPETLKWWVRKQQRNLNCYVSDLLGDEILLREKGASWSVQKDENIVYAIKRDYKVD